MQLASLLSTILVALIALACAFIAYREARDAEAAESRIEKTIARLAGLAARVAAVEASFESLRLQHQKLHGKFHAELREWRAAMDEATAIEENAETIDSGGPRSEARQPNVAYCENYAVAQREGPQSSAAQCECEYCILKRALRAELRDKARQLPSHAATVRAIKAAADGQE